MVRMTMEEESRGQMRMVGNIVCKICKATGSVHLWLLWLLGMGWEWDGNGGSWDPSTDPWSNDVRCWCWPLAMCVAQIWNLFARESRVGANETEMHATSHAKVLGVVGNATDICAANTDN